jgi:hypothetical protein
MLFIHLRLVLLRVFSDKSFGVINSDSITLPLAVSYITTTLKVYIIISEYRVLQMF